MKNFKLLHQTTDRKNNLTNKWQCELFMQTTETWHFQNANTASLSSVTWHLKADVKNRRLAHNPSHGLLTGYLPPPITYVSHEHVSALIFFISFSQHSPLTPVAFEKQPAKQRWDVVCQTGADQPQNGLASGVRSLEGKENPRGSTWE